MRPELFRLFDVAFPSYFVLLLSGFLFATALGALWARRIGQDPDVIVDLGLALLLAGVVGARLLHVFADGHFWDYVHLCTDPQLVDWTFDRAECVSAAYDGVWDAASGVCHPKASDCFAWAKFWAGGLTYYGGFLGASAMAVFLLRRDRFPFWKAADMAGFAVPLGLGFGRMGCLLAGCCFGSRRSCRGRCRSRRDSPASEAQFKPTCLRARAVVASPCTRRRSTSRRLSLAIAAFCLSLRARRKRYDGQVFAASSRSTRSAASLLEFLRARRSRRPARPLDVAAHRPRALWGFVARSTARARLERRDACLDEDHELLNP